MAVCSKVKMGPQLLFSLTLLVKGRGKGHTHAHTHICHFQATADAKLSSIFLPFPLNLWHCAAKKKREKEHSWIVGTY